MRPNNNKAIDAADISASAYSDPVPASQILAVSVQSKISDGTAPTGSLRLEVSNDSINPVNWSLAGSAVAVTDNGLFPIPKTEICNQWYRIAYVRASGDGTLTANVNTFGI